MWTFPSFPFLPNSRCPFLRHLYPRKAHQPVQSSPLHKESVRGKANSTEPANVTHYLCTAKRKNHCLLKCNTKKWRTENTLKPISDEQGNKNFSGIVFVLHFHTVHMGSFPLAWISNIMKYCHIKLFFSLHCFISLWGKWLKHEADTDNLTFVVPLPVQFIFFSQAASTSPNFLLFTPIMVNPHKLVGFQALFPFSLQSSYLIHCHYSLEAKPCLDATHGPPQRMQGGSASVSARKRMSNYLWRFAAASLLLPFDWGPTPARGLYADSLGRQPMGRQKCGNSLSLLARH